MENLKICEAQHSKDNISSMFQMECDAVVEMLMQEKAKSFDIFFNKIPTAMRPDSLSPSSAYTDNASSAVRLLVKGGDLDSNDKNEEETVQLILQALLNNSEAKDEIIATETVCRAQPQVDLEQLLSSPSQTDDCNTKRP